MNFVNKYRFLLLIFIFFSCNNDEIPSINIQIIKYIKSNKYKTYHEAAYIPRFIIDDFVHKSDPNSNFQDRESVKRGKIESTNVLEVITYGRKYLYSVFLSENACLIFYNVEGDLFSSNYVDFYVFKNPKFHKRFKCTGVVNSKESLIEFFETNRDIVFLKDFKY